MKSEDPVKMTVVGLTHTIPDFENRNMTKKLTKKQDFFQDLEEFGSLTLSFGQNVGIVFNKSLNIVYYSRWLTVVNVVQHCSTLFNTRDGAITHTTHALCENWSRRYENSTISRCTVSHSTLVLAKIISARVSALAFFPL